MGWVSLSERVFPSIAVEWCVRATSKRWPSSAVTSAGSGLMAFSQACAVVSSASEITYSPFITSDASHKCSPVRQRKAEAFAAGRELSCSNV